jgi:hypothetical protein
MLRHASGPANAASASCFIDVFAERTTDDLGIEPQYQATDGSHHDDAGHRVRFQSAVEIIEPYPCTLTECRRETGR